jgi:preprotein translocase subunit SecD
VSTEPPSRPRHAPGWGRLLLATLAVVAVGAFAVWLSLRPDTSANGSSRANCTGLREIRTVELAADRPTRPAQLSAVADVLRERLKLYDCSGDTSARVKADRLVVSGGTAALAHLDEVITPGHLQFREVLESRPATQCLPVSSIPSVVDDLTACSADGLEQFRLGAAKVVESDLESATARRDRVTGDWQLALAFTDRGQRAFTELTSQLVGKRMAIVLDGKVLSAPTVTTRIKGDAQVNGSFSEDSAKGLANTLTHGPLPVLLRRV